MSYEMPMVETKRTGKRRFSLPNLTGKFGISFYIGRKEVFIGIGISDTVLEKVIRRRVVPVSQAKTQVYRFDPTGESTED